MNEKTFFSKAIAMQSRFSEDFLRMAEYNPLACNVYNFLIGGGDPYKVIEELVIKRESLLKDFKENMQEKTK